MEKITSFTINHLKLLPGVYVSRRDNFRGAAVTTFDLRLTRPNVDPVLDTGTVHAIEHLAATFLRNDAEYADKTLYFGPMGCRTGFYLLLFGDRESANIVPLLIRTFEFIKNFEGSIPGATPRNCGNFSDMNLAGAKAAAAAYVCVLKSITPERLVYPQ